MWQTINNAQWPTLQGVNNALSARGQLNKGNVYKDETETTSSEQSLDLSDISMFRTRMYFTDKLMKWVKSS